MSVLSMIAPPPARPRDPIAAEAPQPRRYSRELLELAVAQYEAAHRLEREVGQASITDPELVRWLTVATLGRSCAESALLTAILAHDPAVPENNLHICERLYHRGHGVRSGGRIYLALPWPHFDLTDKPPGGSMIHLVVLDADAIDMPEANGAGGV